MFLSAEQMAVVNAGLPHTQQSGWKFIDLPIGPQPLPNWLRGMHVNFWDNYGNSPDFKLKTKGPARDWHNKRFERNGSMFIAKSNDGRAEIYYQSGSLQTAQVSRFRAADGTIKRAPQWSGSKAEPGEWIKVPMLCTRQEDGFGGAHIPITMQDGTEIMLRGPWHGCPPAGYTDVSYVDMLYYKTDSFKNRRWYEVGGVGGLYVSDDLLIRAFARFCPHLRLARVNEGYGLSLQPLKPEWTAPKHWMLSAREKP